MITKYNLFGTILFFIFLVLKLCHQIDSWSWWWVFSPFWVPLVAVVVIGVGFLISYGFMLRKQVKEGGG